MRAVLDFNVDEVHRIVEHAKAAPAHMPHFGEAQGACVLLVKDSGIYLMSNGLPHDPVTPGARSRFVAYAKNYGPTAYAACRAAVGGDDFTEPFPLEEFALAIGGATHVRIVVTEKSVHVQTA